MNRQPVFDWNEETGVATCVLKDKEHSYYGVAHCSPKDEDMKSQKTGLTIAYRRAFISALCQRRDELKNQLKGLHDFYYSINTSKYFDKNSYPIRQLTSSIKRLEFYLRSIREEIKIEKDDLRKYMSDKAVFYNKIRANRKADLNQ